jgi:hypothetical protein
MLMNGSAEIPETPEHQTEKTLGGALGSFLSGTVP